MFVYYSGGLLLEDNMIDKYYNLIQKSIYILIIVILFCSLVYYFPSRAIEVNREE